ncbi:cytosine permease [Acrocarpospora macrocephala]|uniref:Cytosine/uracil/thiamine/allantoin permease n=1 Tax=Acrocarpospora macrocephala TaxID=150177 RepID=A0A5M3WF51_9ACTN|nr:cytosine permease [Acrocarpospora macrocephala]GES07604.1 cytosine/uracil/thiamine/allantoin permease [Acrocarpospora macrocephala]
MIERGESGWPIPRSERPWSGLPVFFASASTAIATWCFFIGGQVADYLNATAGTLTIICGSLLGILPVILACLPPCGKYGVDSVVTSKAQLGTRGSIFAIALIYVSIVGWNVILMISFSRAGAEILIATGVAPRSARTLLETAMSLIGAAVVWYALRKGADSLRSATTFMAPGVIVLGLVVLGLLIQRIGWHEIAAAEPVAARPDPRYNYATGVELLVSSNLSWWPYAGAIIRLSPSVRATLWPSVFGLGLSVGLVSLIGLYTGLAVPGSGGDPTRHLLALGGLWVALAGLAFIVLANVATIVVGSYVAALALRQVPPVNRAHWNVSTLAAIIPATIASAFFAVPSAEHFRTFLAFCGVLFGPMAGIQIADYYLLRGRRLDIAAAFDNSRHSAYYFWNGINPVGFAALAAGFAGYFYLLNPLTYTSHPPYDYITAAIPAALLSAAIYTLGVTLILRPSGKGGYHRQGKR